MKNLISTLLLCAAGVPLLFGQEIKQTEYTNFEDTLFTLNETTVVARKAKRAEMFKMNVPIKYLPVSVNSLSFDKLEIRGIQEVQEATRFLPGVRMQTLYGGFQTLTIRGFGSAPIMIDGIRDERTMLTSYPLGDLSSVESIELLKGPSSVMYGHSVVGGVLNIVRKTPIDKQSLNARVSYGSFNDRRATIGLGGKLVGPVNYIGSFNFADQDGWRNTGNKRLSGYLGIASTIGSKGNLDVRGSFNSDFYGTEIGLPDNMKADVYNAATGSLYLKKDQMQPGLNKEARYNNESDFFKNKSVNAIAKYVHAFTKNLKLEEKFAYFYDDINYFGTEALDYLESDNPIYNHYYIKGDKRRYICLDTVQLTYPLRFSHVSHTISNQLELSGKFFTGEVLHNFMGGYSVTMVNRDSYTGYELGTDVKGPGLYSKVPVHDPHSMGYMTSSFSKVNVTRTLFNAIYLQNLMSINDYLKVLLAGRYDFYDYESANAPTPTGERTHDPASRSPFNRILNSAFTYRVGAVYLPKPQTSIYASLSTFFKPIRTFYSPTTIYVNNQGQVYQPKENEEVFKPESGYQVEAGVKYTLNTVLTANASLFYIRRTNSTQRLGSKQEEVGGKLITKTITGQVGVMDSKGFDVELNYTPTKTLDIMVGYSLTDARIRDMAKITDPDILPYIDPSINENTGKRQTMVPMHNFYALGNYTIPSGLFKNLGFNVSVNYNDKVYRTVGNDRWFNSFWMTDAGVSYTLKNNIRLSVNVNNLFNVDYINQALDEQMVPGVPRNFLATISYRL